MPVVERVAAGDGGGVRRRRSMSWSIARMVRSGRIVAHGKLVAIGYLGSQRTTRRWVADVEAAVAAQARSADSAVDPGAGVVDAVGLW